MNQEDDSYKFRRHDIMHSNIYTTLKLIWYDIKSLILSLSLYFSIELWFSQLSAASSDDTHIIWVSYLQVHIEIGKRSLILHMVLQFCSRSRERWLSILLLNRNKFEICQKNVFLLLCYGWIEETIINEMFTEREKTLMYLDEE